MKSISIRSIPDEIYSKLQEWAKKNHRSLQEQIKSILEREVHLISGGQVLQAQKWRKKLADRKWGNVVEDVRKERLR